MPSGEPVSFLRQPAQQVTRHETGESEVRRVWQQFVVGLLLSEVAWLAMLAIVGILGQAVVAAIVAVVLLTAGAVVFWRCASWMQRGVVMIVAAAVLYLWLVFAPDVVAWLWAWGTLWRVWALGALLVFLGCAAFLVWRMFVEIVNPNWPPPLNPRNAGDGGVGWPGTTYRDPNAPLVREVEPREPVLVYAGRREEPRAEQREEIRQAMQAAGIGAAEATRTPEQEQRDALLAFIARGATIGFSRRAWEGRVTQQWWNETTAMLKAAGVLRVVGNRTELACSVREALEAVR